MLYYRPMTHPRESGIPPQGTETRRPVEHRAYTKKDFLDDNRSAGEKGGKIDRWMINYEGGNHVVLRDCTDARNTFDDEITTEESSISTGSAHKSSFAPRYNDPRVSAVVNRTHFDALLSEPGKRPVGCGGQDTRELIRNGSVVPSEGATLFVADNVHEDPLVQSFLQAKDIISHRLTGKIGRVFVTTLDHRSGEVIPVGEYIRAHGIEYRAIPIVLTDLVDATDDDQRQKFYHPREIYAEGIPRLPMTQLSPEFQEYLKVEERKMLELHDIYKDFSTRQAVQDPTFFAIGTNKIPFRTRFPGIFGELGSLFKIHIPRRKTEQFVQIEQSAIEEAVRQLHYGVGKSLAHHGEPGKEFASTHVLFIDTGDFSQSERIAGNLMGHAWFRDWAGLPGHQIFAAESRSGNTLRVEELPLTA